jgi:hypothetical protein
VRSRVTYPRRSDTLATRYQLAYWTGECGEYPKVLFQFEGLVPDQERVRGPITPDTLSTRFRPLPRIPV